MQPYSLCIRCPCYIIIIIITVCKIIAHHMIYLFICVLKLCVQHFVSLLFVIVFLIFTLLNQLYLSNNYIIYPIGIIIRIKCMKIIYEYLNAWLLIVNYYVGGAYLCACALRIST